MFTNGTYSKLLSTVVVSVTTPRYPVRISTNRHKQTIVPVLVPEGKSKEYVVKSKESCRSKLRECITHVRNMSSVVVSVKQDRSHTTDDSHSKVQTRSHACSIFIVEGVPTKPICSSPFPFPFLGSPAISPTLPKVGLLSAESKVDVLQRRDNCIPY